MVHIRGSLRAALVGVVATSLAWGGLAATSTAWAVDDIPRICLSEVNVSESFGADTSGLDDGVLILDGRTVTLADDSASWQVYDPIDNTFQQPVPRNAVARFRGP
jgi:hypothetical protein